MKLKVMIVDDEQLSVKYLQDLINWNIYGMELTPTAANGKDALMLYNRYQPDIVITDITMPVMNGLELAWAIRDISESTYIVFLTAYNDFHFVRDALRIRASDYILKDEISQSYLLQKMLLIRSEYIKSQMWTRTLFEHEVGQLFGGGAGNFMFENMDPKVKEMFSWDYYAAIIERDEPLDSLMTLSGKKRSPSLDFNEIKALCSGLEEDGEYICVARMTANRFLLLYADRAKNNQVRRYQRFRTALNRIEESLRINLQRQFTVFCFSGEYRPELFYRKFERENYCFNKKYFSCTNRILALDELVGYRRIFNEPTYADFRKALENLSIEDAEKAISALLKTAFQMKDAEYLENALCGAVRIVKDVFSNVLDVSSGLEIELFEEGCEKEWYLFEGAAAWLRRTVVRLIRIVCENQSMNYSRSVLDAIDYIRVNYGNPKLDVEAIAVRTHMCKSWLSVQFKNETGRTIVEYLTRYRITMAKKLIDEHHKIFETASMTGFSSSQYFCKVFKRIEGVSPVEYKNGKRSDEEMVSES